MGTDACLGCGKSLPANKELASVPNGRLVAFDPGANRVWRICAKCHHWNLLGPEASAAAVPELAARFASLPSAGPEGLAKAKVSGKLDLYRVGGPQERAAAILELSEVRREMLAPVSLGTRVVFGAFLLYLVSNLHRVIVHPRWDAYTGLAICFGISWTIIEVPTTPRAANRRQANRWWAFGFMVVGVIAASLGTLDYQWAFLAAGLGVLFGWVGRRDAKRTSILTWTPGDSDLRFTGQEMRGLGDEWLSALILPEISTPQQAADALDQFERLGSLPRVLAYLTSDRGLPEGRLALTGMAVVDQLLLSVAARVAGAEPTAPIRAGLPNARTIAQVAEALDRPPEGAS